MADRLITRSFPLRFTIRSRIGLRLRMNVLLVCFVCTWMTSSRFLMCSRIFNGTRCTLFDCFFSPRCVASGFTIVSTTFTSTMFVTSFLLFLWFFVFVILVLLVTLECVRGYCCQEFSDVRNIFTIVCGLEHWLSVRCNAIIGCLRRCCHDYFPTANE